MAVKWTEEQQKVISLRDRNILVSAAAGSGKTAVLVERIIRKLTDETAPSDVDRLLIVTFTALVQRFISLVKAFSAGTGMFMVEGLQLIVAVLLMVLGVTIVVTSGKELVRKI